VPSAVGLLVAAVTGFLVTLARFGGVAFGLLAHFKIGAADGVLLGALPVFGLAHAGGSKGTLAGGLLVFGQSPQDHARARSLLARRFATATGGLGAGWSAGARTLVARALG